MEAIIIIVIIAAFALVVIKSLRSGTSKSKYVIENNAPNTDLEPKYKKTLPEEMQAARQKKIKSQPTKIEQLEQTPSSGEGYSYYEMVGMYNIGIRPNDFGIYKGYAVAETNNPHDKHAVGIYRKGDNKLMGYVPREFRGESNEMLHRKILYQGGVVDSVFKIQGSAQRCYGSVYIKEGCKIFRNGDTKSPYKSKTTKEFAFAANKEFNGKYKCYLKIDNPKDEYDYTVSLFNESGELLGKTDNNELQLFDYVNENENNVLAWCWIDSNVKKYTLYVPLNLTEKAILRKLNDFLTT